MSSKQGGILGEKLEIMDSTAMPGLVLVQGADAADSRLGLRYFQVEKSDTRQCRGVNGVLLLVD